MKNNNLIIYLLLFILIPHISFADSTTVDYFSSKNVKKFAKLLFEEKDFHRAAIEYQRYFVLTNVSKDSVLYKTALCYELDNQYQRANSFYHKIIENFSDSQLSDYSKYKIALNLHNLKQFHLSTQYIQNTLPGIRFHNIINDCQYLTGTNFILQNKWSDALSHFEKVQSSSKNYEMDIRFSEIKKNIKKRFDLPEKNPVVAGLLSTIFPGLGKIYCKQRGDGLYSLLLISLTGYLSWDGFSDNGRKSVKGWIFGTMGSTFYLGNIYGSAVAARVYNDKLLEKYMNSKNFQFKLYYDFQF